MNTDTTANPSDNSYDIHAEAWANRNRSGSNWVHEHLEKPAILTLADFKTGEEVVCLGCGSGEEVRMIEKNGAKVIAGIDKSEALLAKAREWNPKTVFRTGSISDPELNPASCDVVFSSLAMHYAEDWTTCLQNVRRALRPNGRFIFSTHHPLLWSSQTTRDESGTTRMHGYAKNKDSKPTIYGDCVKDRWIDDIWFENMHVRYHHKSLSTMMRFLIASGMSILTMTEPLATDDGTSSGAIYSRIPPFLLVRLDVI